MGTRFKKELAKLAGGVAVIRVGAPSESEMKSRKERSTTLSAQPGLPLPRESCPEADWRCFVAWVPVADEETNVKADEKTVVQILPRALEALTRQIAENSAVDGSVVVARILSGKGSEGFDGERKEYVDLVETGIIDPTKVVPSLSKTRCLLRACCC